MGEQGIERGGDLLLCGFHFRRGGLGANEFLQRAGGGLDGFGADVAGHAFERVREALGESGVALSQRGGDLPDRRALLLDELAEEFQIELPISRDAGQAVLRVEAVDGREVSLAPAGLPPMPARDRARLTSTAFAPDGGRLAEGRG